MRNLSWQSTTEHLYLEFSVGEENQLILAYLPEAASGVFLPPSALTTFKRDISEILA